MAGLQGTATRRDLIEAFSAMIEAERRDMRVAARGRVVSYDPASQTATVKPLMKQSFAGQELEAPELLSVPVRQPRGGGFALHLPIRAGDEVDLHFADRSLDAYQAQGASVDAAPGRMNDLSDAFAVPGGSSAQTALSGVPTDQLHFGSEDTKKGLRVGQDGKVALVGGPNGGDRFVVTPQGRVDMRGANGDGLLDILREFLVIFRDHVHSGGAHDKVTQAQALINRIDGIKA